MVGTCGRAVRGQAVQMERRILAITFLFVACASSHAEREGARDNEGQARGGARGDSTLAPVSEEAFGAALAEVMLRETERCCEQAGLPLETPDERVAAFAQAFAPADPDSGARFQPAVAAVCLDSIDTRACLRSKDAAPAETVRRLHKSSDLDSIGCAFCEIEAARVERRQEGQRQRRHPERAVHAEARREPRGEGQHRAARSGRAA